MGLRIRPQPSPLEIRQSLSPNLMIRPKPELVYCYMWLSTLLAGISLASPQGDIASQVQTLIGQLGPRGLRGYCAVGWQKWGRGSAGEAAAVKLVAIGEPAVEPLIALLVNTAAELDSKRDLALWTLGQIGDRRAIKPTLEILEARTLPVRDLASAGEAASVLGAVEGIPLLIKLLGDERRIPSSPHLTLGYFIQQDLVRFGAVAADPLMDVVLSATGTARRCAAEALAKLKDPRAGSAFKAMLENGDRIERIVAADGLGELNDRSADALLLSKLADPDDLVAEHAASAIGRRGPSALPLLKPFMSSPDPTVRRFALFGSCFATYGSHECHEMLRAAFKDRAPEVRWQALQILGYQANIGTQTQSLVDALTKDKDPRVRDCAKATLLLSKGSIRIQPATNWR
jgi:HEAT repeat protein